MIQAGTVLVWGVFGGATYFTLPINFCAVRRKIHRTSPRLLITVPTNPKTSLRRYQTLHPNLGDGKLAIDRLFPTHETITHLTSLAWRVGS